MITGSQSPQTGQFNSYIIWFPFKFKPEELKSQSPQTGQFNSYITISMFLGLILTIMSQSPQTGQFNSYIIGSLYDIWNSLHRLNPLKRVNSILTLYIENKDDNLKKSQSPQTGQFNSYRNVSFT